MQTLSIDKGRRSHYHPLRTGGAAVVVSLVTFALTVLAFGAVIIGALAISMPGAPTAPVTTTTVIACPAQPVQFACRVSGGAR